MIGGVLWSLCVVELDFGDDFRSLYECCRSVCIESLTYSCFCELMKRMSANFPHGGAMDTHFANMRSLIQVNH